MDNKKILVLTNSIGGLYRFRYQLMQRLIDSEYKVWISVPSGEYSSPFISIGCQLIATKIERRRMNPIADFKLLFTYHKMMKSIKPDIVLTYTIKPNVYGGLVARSMSIPVISNVTGMGSGIKKNGFPKKIIHFLYKQGLFRSKCVFFQNTYNQRYFFSKKLVNSETKLIPGSGVSLDSFPYSDYPTPNKAIHFLFIGRVMKEKGIDEYIEAAKKVKDKHPEVFFQVAGSCEEDRYKETLSTLQREQVLDYLGVLSDVHDVLKKSHAVILPSYHEGMSNVLLEAAATGRPVLASNIPGCLETFDDGISGIGFEPRNVDSLTDAIIRFINLPYAEKEEMGRKGRLKVENEFNRDLVVNAYMEQIKKIEEGTKNA